MAVITTTDHIWFADYFTAATLNAKWTAATPGGAISPNVEVEHRDRLDFNKTVSGLAAQCSVTGSLGSPSVNKYLVDYHIASHAGYSVLPSTFSLLTTAGSVVCSVAASSDLSLTFTVTGSTASQVKQLAATYDGNYVNLYVDKSANTVRAFTAKYKELSTQNGAWAPFGAAVTYTTSDPTKMSITTAGTTTGHRYYSAVEVYDPSRFVAIGDSITRGHKNEDAIGGVTYTVDNDWPHKVTAALGDYRIVNRGIGSDDTADMVARFHDDVATFEPDCVIIHAGVAAILTGENAATMLANVGAMAASVTAWGGKVVITDIGPSSDFNLATEKATRATYNDSLSTLAATNIVIVRVSDSYAKGGGASAALATDMDYDGTHPNNLGNIAIGQTIQPFLAASMSRSWVQATLYATQDSWMEYKAPTSNFSGDAYGFIGDVSDSGPTGDDRTRIVLKFGNVTASLPSTSTVFAVQPSMWCEGGARGGTGVPASVRAGFYRLDRAWVNASVSWNKYATASWTTAGGLGTGDARSTVLSASLRFFGTDTDRWATWQSTAGGVADVQAWLAGSTNNGWLVAATAAEGFAAAGAQFYERFQSIEGANIPKLYTTYYLAATATPVTGTSDSAGAYFFFQRHRR